MKYKIDDINKMVFLYKKNRNDPVSDELQHIIAEHKKKKYHVCTYIHGKENALEIFHQIIMNHA